jgi:hypothetical protein
MEGALARRPANPGTTLNAWRSIRPFSHSSTPRTENVWQGSRLLADTFHKDEDVPGNEERFIGILQFWCKHQWRLIAATVVLLEEKAHET